MEGFEPPTDQSEIVKLSTVPRGTRQLPLVEERAFFIRWFFFEFILSLEAHPAPGISFLLLCKMVKNETKPRLRNFWVLYPEIANIHIWANPSSTRWPSPAALSQGVLKRTKRVPVMTSTHVCVQWSILVFANIQTLNSTWLILTWGQWSNRVSFQHHQPNLIKHLLHNENKFSKSRTIFSFSFWISEVHCTAPLSVGQQPSSCLYKYVIYLISKIRSMAAYGCEAPSHGHTLTQPVCRYAPASLVKHSLGNRAQPWLICFI